MKIRQGIGLVGSLVAILVVVGLVVAIIFSLSGSGKRSSEDQLTPPSPPSDLVTQ